MNKKPIGCATHDYIEIACLYHFRLNLVMQNNSTIQGIAKTTKTTKDKNEYLILQQDQNSISVEMGSIKIMQSLTSNPYFETVNF